MGSVRQHTYGTWRRAAVSVDIGVYPPGQGLWRSNHRSFVPAMNMRAVARALKENSLPPLRSPSLVR